MNIYTGAQQPRRPLSAVRSRAHPLSLHDHLISAGAAPLGSRWEPAGSLGQVVITPDGQPIRTIITGRRRQVTGSYSSRKAGRGFPFESMNEQALLMHSEVDTDVVTFAAQPCRFEFTVEGRSRVYIADCGRLLSDGTIEIVEVKNDRRHLQDRDYAAKLERVEAICEAVGWTFRTVFSHELFLPKVRHENVVEIQSQSTATFDVADEYVARVALARGGGRITLGELADALGGRQRGMAIAKAMMVHRIVAIDLERPLCRASAVTLVTSFVEGVQ